MRGVIGIGNVLSSRDSKKLFIPEFFELNNTLPKILKLGGACYGGCSLVVERSVVVRMARVRFSASALCD